MIYVCHLLMSDSGFVFRSISKAMDELRTGPTFDAAALDRLKIYVTECIDKYGDDYQYSTDPRLLKIWILYVTEWFLDVNSDVTPMSCSFVYFSALLCAFFCYFRRMQLVILTRYISSWRRKECLWSMRCSMKHMHCFCFLRGKC